MSGRDVCDSHDPLSQAEAAPRTHGRARRPAPPRSDPGVRALARCADPLALEASRHASKRADRLLGWSVVAGFAAWLSQKLAGGNVLETALTAPACVRAA